MKERNLKLIMELIFIFILPLAFILPCIQIENNYTYDNVGNFEVSNKIIDFDTPFSYDKLVSNVINGEFIVDNNNGFTTITLNITNNNLDFYVKNTSNNYLWVGINLGDIYGNWTIIVDKSNNTAYIDFNVANLYITYSNLVINDDYVLIHFNSYSYVDFVDEYDFVETDSSISSNEIYQSVYTLMGNIKLLFTNYLDFNDSVILDLFIAYNTLWLMMFISWHFLYALFDFVAHLLKIPIKRRE